MVVRLFSFILILIPKMLRQCLPVLVHPRRRQRPVWPQRLRFGITFRCIRLASFVEADLAIAVDDVVFIIDGYAITDLY